MFFHLNSLKWRPSSKAAKLGSNGIFLQGPTLILFYLVCLLNTRNYAVMGTECMKRKYFELTSGYSYLGVLPSSFNRTLKCEAYFQWTVADFCCYDKYDRFEQQPFCCISETYKLVIAVGLICLVLFIGTFSLFFCWVYNLPHHLLCCITCGRFHLNNWLLKNKNGPYVDPSFYAGEPFWSRGAEMQPYPLRPMPPKIFYPAPPPKLKYRWDVSNCDIPLFIIASRQFTRNPYSARPQDRHNSSQNIAQLSLTNGGGTSESRRSSLSSNWGSSGVTSNSSTANSSSGGPTRGGETQPSSYAATVAAARRDSSSAPNGIFRRGSSALHQRGQSGNKNDKNNPPFKVNLDEGEATAELIEALKVINEGIQNSEINPATNQIINAGTLEQNQSGGKQQQSSSSNKSVDDEQNDDFDNNLHSIRPNTTGGEGGNLDQYGNYVSLSNNRALAGFQQFTKPNTAALNQQLTNLRLPVYSMPGVHTANVLSTVQNYHVVSSNLGNPMETILEDESYEDEYNDVGNASETHRSGSNESPTESIMSNGGGGKTQSSPFNNESSKQQATERHPYQNNKRRATLVNTDSESIRSTISRMDHVVVPTPTTRAVVPFTPTLPGSLSENVGGGATTDSELFAQLNNRKEFRRNSVI